MDINEYEKTLKKTILSCSKDVFSTNYQREHILQILPHRDPFLLIDRITKVNLVEKMITCESDIRSEDPVFTGHFPDNPIYPGVLQLEMMGQAGLCLAYFVRNNSVFLYRDTVVKGLFVKVHKAAFLQPILPQDQIKILGRIIEYDDFLGILACQVVKENKICSYGVLEVYFDD